jgi:hypothetical protein
MKLFADALLGRTTKRRAKSNRLGKHYYNHGREIEMRARRTPIARTAYLLRVRRTIASTQDKRKSYITF